MTEDVWFAELGTDIVEETSEQTQCVDCNDLERFCRKVYDNFPLRLILS